MIIAMKISNAEFDAKWTLDCQGKQDFDFPVLSVSCRYYPDYTVIASIYLGKEELLDSGWIKGETETECKYKAEEWVKQNLTALIARIR